jgi:riboflavin biosynthesis pyrimidine reductase
MLEAGPNLATEFLRHNLIDRVTLFQNPSFIGYGRDLFSDLDLAKLSSRPRLTEVESRWIENDHLMTGKLLCSQD